MTNEKLLDCLNDLIETCKDGEYGFNACAEQAKAPEVKSALTQHAGECRQGAQELQNLVVQNGGKPDTGGTVAGAMHRGWVAVRGTLSTYDDKAVLEECERGEDRAVAAYRKALAEDLPATVRPVIERQFQGVQRNHDHVRALRDQYRAQGQTQSS